VKNCVEQLGLGVAAALVGATIINAAAAATRVSKTVFIVRDGLSQL
jgi:hypothetical protein